MSGPSVTGSDGRRKDRTGVAPQGAVLHVSRLGAMTVNSGVDTVIGFDTRDYDPFGWFDTASGRFTPKVPGYYRVSANMLFTGVATGSRWIAHFRKNGATGEWRRVADLSWGANNDGGLGGTDLIYLNGGSDYLEFTVYQNTGGSRSIIVGTGYCFMAAELVGTSVGVVPEPWHRVGDPGEPAFQSSWVNYDSNRPAAFFKDPHGIVHCKGLVKSGATGSVVFALPPGYRHDQADNIHLPCVSNQAFGYWQISPTTGTVTLAVGSGSWADLGSIRFRAA